MGLVWDWSHDVAGQSPVWSHWSTPLKGWDRGPPDPTLPWLRQSRLTGNARRQRLQDRRKTMSSGLSENTSLVGAKHRHRVAEPEPVLSRIAQQAREQRHRRR